MVLGWHSALGLPFLRPSAHSAARRHLRQARNGLSCIFQSLILNGHLTRLTCSASSN